MRRLIEGVERTRIILFPPQLDKYVTEENAVRVIDTFIDTLDLQALGFLSADPAQRATGLSFRRTPENLHLRLSQPHPVQRPSRA